MASPYTLSCYPSIRQTVLPNRGKVYNPILSKNHKVSNLQVVTNPILQTSKCPDRPGGYPPKRKNNTLSQWLQTSSNTPDHKTLDSNTTSWLFFQNILHFQYFKKGYINLLIYRFISYLCVVCVVCVCVFVCTCVCTCECRNRKRASVPPDTGVTGIYELPDMDAGNQTPVL